MIIFIEGWLAKGGVFVAHEKGIVITGPRKPELEIMFSKVTNH